MNKKTLIILAVILVVVFVCGLGIGALGPCDPKQDSNCKISLSPPAWLGSLGGLLGGSSPLRSQDFPNPPGCFHLTSSSTPDFNVAPGTDCIVSIAASSSPVRKATLVWTQGLVDVLFSPGSQGLEVNTSLNASDNTLDLTIQEEGATLKLTCSGGAQCLVRLD